MQDNHHSSLASRLPHRGRPTKCAPFTSPLKGPFSKTSFEPAHSTASKSPPTPPKSNSIVHNRAIHQRSATSKITHAKYTFDTGPQNAPGSATYYKSWTFRKKVISGCALRPGEDDGNGKDFDDDADKDYGKKARQISKPSSLIMIIGRVSARRAKAQRKVDKRSQRTNRRADFLRRTEGARSLFE